MPEFIRGVPPGDNRERMICADCGHITYENPKVVVGSVVVADDAVLMCRRAIEPRRGFWTLPAGYLELGETLEERLAVGEVASEPFVHEHVGAVLVGCAALGVEAQDLVKPRADADELWG